ncbi:MAG: TIGR03621 family F420-dependent LLM class oxidoreductase [Acidimicrobiales bacterium]
MRAFRFGVQAAGAPSGGAWRALARRAEDLGYSTLCMPDHFDDQWSPIVAMTVAAEATERLVVGALVFNNDLRHPLVLAREMATLDLVAEGRVEVGLGAGWMASDYDAAGVVLDAPAVRVERLGEAVAVMKRLWSDGSCTFAGEHYQLRAAGSRPRLPGGRRPALVIGGGVRQVLRLAAREADVVGVHVDLRSGRFDGAVIRSALAERYRRRLAWVRESAGDRWDEVELQCLTFVVMVTDSGARIIEQVAPAFGLTPAEAREVPNVLVGSVDAIVETVQRRREELGFSYLVVHQGEMEAFAPVVARLAGT